LASENIPLSAITFSEVLNTSDLPAGVVNILTGKFDEIGSQMADHMDVNALVIAREEIEAKDLQVKSAANLKRVFVYSSDNWFDASHENPYYILDLQEIKTTWHPIENIGSSKAGY
jgi:hypothetical protein